MKILSGISEGQVLQRRGKNGATAVMAGESAADGPMIVTITRGGTALPGWKRRKVGAARAGRFSIRLAGIPAGGPYRLKLERGGRQPASATVRSFYVGDVWILAGQSNMEGAGKLPALAGPHPLVRALSQRREWRRAEDPLHVHVESPDACHNYGRQIGPGPAEEWRRRAGSGAGAGVHFGRELVKRTGVPQGLICTARGGSSMSLWDPTKTDQLYASMMASVRITGQPVAGMLWYQGESDTGEASARDYTGNMQALVAATRRDLQLPRLPWVIVQLGRVARDGTGALWNLVQEQQRELPRKIPDLAMVAAIDLLLDDQIHIGAADMPRLGARLARAAVRLALGDRSEPPVPQLRAVRRAISFENGSSHGKCAVDVLFDGVDGGLRSAGEPAGFYVLGPKGEDLAVIFKTTLHVDFVRLHLTKLPPPGSRVGYGRGYYPHCTVTDGRDLALPLFQPVPVTGDEGVLPFLTRWKVYPPVLTKDSIEKARPPKNTADERVVKTYADGFINEHDSWQGKSGHAFFSASLELARAQPVTLLMGYDGPFRLWLDGRPVFSNPQGCNPCIPDESGRNVRLSAGRHEIVVGMDMGYGRSWGFFLRLRIQGAASLEQAGVRYVD